MSPDTALVTYRRARLRAWIAEKNGKIAADAIGDDTPLLEERILTSLHVIDLILFLEELRGEPLDLEDFDKHAFRSLATLSRNFLEGDAGDAAAAATVAA